MRELVLEPTLESDEESNVSFSDASEETLVEQENQHYNRMVRMWRKQRPNIEATYDSDSSDEETLNTIGNVPIEWYKDLPHIGYDREGRRIMKGEAQDDIDKFLDSDWQSVLHTLEGKEVKLTPEQLQLLERIQKRQYPDASFDPYEDYVEWFSSKVEIMPISSAPEPKSRFIPSKSEAQKIMKMARSIRQGLMVPGLKQVKEKKIYDIWAQEGEAKKNHISAPKQSLPQHNESYNPPEEYLLDEDELKEYNDLDPEDRPMNFIPKKFDALRKVPAYPSFIQERFTRCLDLYLCPRMIKQKLDIDPESLIPKLPDPKDLKPFPTKLCITYQGHTEKVRCISVDPTGEYLATGSDDKTVRIWDVTTGRCLQTMEFEHIIMSLEWNPTKNRCLLAATSECVYLLTPSCLDCKPPSIGAEWAVHGDANIIGTLNIKNSTQVMWHRKGDYFATVSPSNGASAVQIHQLSKTMSQTPFSKSKGIVQKVLFHPLQPILFVATQRYIRVYHLVKQELLKTLLPGCRWISSMDIHRGGDNLIVGSYDCRVYWFDLDLSVKPYKTLRVHKSAVRQVKYHSSYPLFASSSDDGSALVFHGMVYNDLMQNALIVPCKSIQAHKVEQHLGALDCQFHPQQPWLFTSGADHQVKLFC